MDYKIDKESANRLILAFTCADKQDWHQFFEFLRQRQFDKLKGLTKAEEILPISNIVLYLFVLEEIVKQIITKKDLTNVI